jgi:hypothetical protein
MIIYNFILQNTYEAALVALGSVVELMEQILKKKITNGLALIRYYLFLSCRKG